MTFEPIKKEHRYVSNFDDSVDICNASSAKECTGLIPYMPKGDDVYETYNDIYAFGPWYRKNF